MLFNVVGEQRAVFEVRVRLIKGPQQEESDTGFFDTRELALKVANLIFETLAPAPEWSEIELAGTGPEVFRAVLAGSSPLVCLSISIHPTLVYRTVYRVVLEHSGNRNLA